MEHLKLEITIASLDNGKSEILTDFPEKANVAFIVGHLEHVSNGLKNKVCEKIDALEFENEESATQYANSLTIEDLL